MWAGAGSTSVVGFTPEAGALALACARCSISYVGVAMNEAHSQVLVQVLSLLATIEVINHSPNSLCTVPQKVLSRHDSACGRHGVGVDPAQPADKSESKSESKSKESKPEPKSKESAKSGSSSDGSDESDGSASGSDESVGDGETQK